MTKPCAIKLSRAWITSLSFMLALVLVTAACSGSDPGEEPTPRPTPTATSAESTQAPTSTPVPAPTPTPTTAAQEPMTEAFPLEVVDMLGRTVEIPARPMRIVTISPTATEMLYVAGGTAIARDTSSTFPAEVAGLPELGGAYSPSFESIAAQGPDLILIEALTQARFLEPLSQLDAPVLAVRATSLEEVTTGIRLIGRTIGRNQTAEQAAEGIAARVSSTVERVSSGKTALIMIGDADRNLYAAKPESYPGAIASMLQLTNPAADLPDSGTFPGFALISAEQVLAFDPEYVFAISPQPVPAPRLSAVLPLIPGFSNLRAITSGQMHELDHVIFLRNPGPRIAEAAEAMAEIVGGSP